MNRPLAEFREASFGYRGKIVVPGISLRIERGEMLCLLGPNGAGKTTLFKALLGFIGLSSGEILLAGRPLAEYTMRELARRAAYVPQAQAQALPFPVLDVVAMGRCSRLGALASPGPKDYAIAEACLGKLGVGRLAASVYSELSGGERQMVLAARAMAQEPELLVLDEPASNLDFGNQVVFLKAIRGLADSGIGVVMTTHSPDHAFLAGDRVVALKGGRIAAEGAPAAVLDEGLLRSLYGVEVRIATLDGPGRGPSARTCIPVMD